MNRPGTGLAYVALTLSILALVSSLVIYNMRVRASGVTGQLAPATISLSMVVATFAGEGVFVHRWYPTMMVVREGDTVDLAVANPDRFSHQFDARLSHRDRKSTTLMPGL